MSTVILRIHVKLSAHLSEITSKYYNGYVTEDLFSFGIVQVIPKATQIFPNLLESCVNNGVDVVPKHFSCFEILENSASVLSKEKNSQSAPRLTVNCGHSQILFGHGQCFCDGAKALSN